jgi:hypothetical protein
MNEKITAAAEANDWIRTNWINNNRETVVYIRGLQRLKMVTVVSSGKIEMIAADGKRINGRSRIAEVIAFLSGPRRDAEPREYPAEMIENDTWAVGI